MLEGYISEKNKKKIKKDDYRMLLYDTFNIFGKEPKKNFNQNIWENLSDKSYLSKIKEEEAEVKELLNESKKILSMKPGAVCMIGVDGLTMSRYTSDVFGTAQIKRLICATIIPSGIEQIDRKNLKMLGELQKLSEEETEELNAFIESGESRSEAIKKGKEYFKKYNHLKKQSEQYMQIKEKGNIYELLERAKRGYIENNYYFLTGMLADRWYYKRKEGEPSFSGELSYMSNDGELTEEIKRDILENLLYRHLYKGETLLVGEMSEDSMIAEVATEMGYHVMNLKKVSSEEGSRETEEIKDDDIENIFEVE